MNSSKGVFLIEAVVAVGILAIGIIVVMESFAMQRKVVTSSQEITRATLVLESIIGAACAGAELDLKDKNDLTVTAGFKDLENDIAGIKVAEFAVAWPSGNKERKISAVTFVQDQGNDKGI